MNSTKAVVFRTSCGWCAVGARSGRVVLVTLPTSGRAQAIRELRHKAGESQIELLSPADSRLLKRAADSITAYFKGKCANYRPSLDVSHGTPFQRAVWRATRGIPRGKVLTYRHIAKRIGRPRASRAVGNALAANPLPVLIPCHRVVKSDGGLGGFQGGKDARLKAKMLKLEGLTAESIRRATRAY